MPTVPDIHRRGTRAAQPTVPDGVLTIGTLYFVTDEGVTERWNGTAWQAYSGGGGGGGGTPSPHKVSHQAGGTDAIPLDTLAAPTDVTTLNADTTKHGLLRKLPGGVTTFLRGDGAFAIPTGPAPYQDLAEGIPADPAADVARLYALDVNGFTQVEIVDGQSKVVRLASDNVVVAKVTEPAGVPRGACLYLVGASGANPLVRLAKADALATMPGLGLALDAGVLNAFIRVLVGGTLAKLDTSGFTEGARVYVSPTTAGALTTTPPGAPAYTQRVGFVTRSHATAGEVLVVTTALDGPPRVHAPSHAAAGDDPVPVTSLAGYPGGTATFLRGDGTFATPATGVPGAHKATHEAGGTDPLTTLDAGILLTGTLPPARIGNDAITYAKLQNLAASRLLGRDATGAGDAQEIDLGSGLVLTGTTLSAPGARNSALVNYTYNTGPEPPVAGQVRANGLHPWTTTTKLWMRTVSADGQDVFWGLMVISIGSTILLQDKDDHTAYVRFTTTGAVIDKGLYVEIPVVWKANGSAIATAAQVLLQSTAETLVGHHATHEPGGSDAIVALDAGILTTGTLAIARIADDALTYAKLQNVSAASRLLGRGSAAGAGDPQELTVGTGLSFTGTVLNADPRLGALGILIDGGGAVITTGVKGFLEVPFACTITGVTLLSSDPAVLAGSIVVDIWKDTYANYPPTVADTITASARPTLSSAVKSKDTTLTGWTKAIAAGDVLGFNVVSVATLQRVMLSLTVQA